MDPFYDRDNQDVNSLGSGSDDLTNSIAHTAAVKGDVCLLKAAILQDPDIMDASDSEGMTPLLHAVSTQKIECLRLLVKMGASIDAQDSCGHSGIALATYAGWFEGLQFLLRNGGIHSLRLTDKHNRTPLHAATYEQDWRILELLLNYVPADDVNKPDNEGMTPLHWAAFHSRVEHIQLLLNKGAALVYIDVDGNTALHWAAQKGSVACCRALCADPERREMVNSEENTGKTAIHLAAATGHQQVIKELATIHCCNLDALDEDERTPLHWAAVTGQHRCISTLLKLGANPSVRDISGITPMDYAVKSCHTECVKLFWKKDKIKLLTSERRVLPYIPQHHMGKGLTTEKQVSTPASLLADDGTHHEKENTPAPAPRNILRFIRHFFRRTQQADAMESTYTSSEAGLQDSFSFSSDQKEPDTQQTILPESNNFSEIVVRNPSKDNSESKSEIFEDLAETTQVVRAPAAGENATVGPLTDAATKLRDADAGAVFESAQPDSQSHGQRAEKAVTVTAAATDYNASDPVTSSVQAIALKTRQNTAPLHAANSARESSDEHCKDRREALMERFKMKEVALQRYSTHFSQATLRCNQVANAQGAHKVNMSTRKEAAAAAAHVTDKGSRLDQTLRAEMLDKLRLSAEQASMSSSSGSKVLPRIHNDSNYWHSSTARMRSLPLLPEQSAPTKGNAWHSSGVIYGSQTAKLASDVRVSPSSMRSSLSDSLSGTSPMYDKKRTDAVHRLAFSKSSRLTLSDSSAPSVLAQPTGDVMQSYDFRKHLQGRRNKLLVKATEHERVDLISSRNRSANVDSASSYITSKPMQMTGGVSNTECSPPTNVGLCIGRDVGRESANRSPNEVLAAQATTTPIASASPRRLDGGHKLPALVKTRAIHRSDDYAKPLLNHDGEYRRLRRSNT
ncbi:PREDICTED: ankyrin repeat domain-containing protein 24-like [Priapulus caudatus]|uniref:Ankyrin repeat domain-containing protein 24-like n=1 Tax=Priapulus caudatus TaxID=37621 RepID=A0ABM1EFE3_PRICU|nr:PREDICTED: ankyrin repeat domain-containing protein 24-like [Priapulus caudatus]